MKITVNCKQCNNEFLKTSSEVNRSKNHYCSNECSRKYNLHLHTIVLPQQRRAKYDINPKKCLHCNVIIPYEDHKTKKYCSSKCFATHSQKEKPYRVWTDDDKQKLSLKIKSPEWQSKHRFCREKTGVMLNCTICETTFYRVPRKPHRVTCSHKCYFEYVKSNNLLKGKRGGYREKGGRGKQGWYKGYYCNSSWELAWVIFQLEHGVQFKRNTEGFKYTFDEIEYKYYPDFQLLDTLDYVEIKGFMSKKNEAKIKDFPHKLFVIDKSEIKKYIDYTIEKYGKSYIDLYE